MSIAQETEFDMRMKVDEQARSGNWRKRRRSTAVRPSYPAVSQCVRLSSTDRLFGQANNHHIAFNKLKSNH